PVKTPHLSLQAARAGLLRREPDRFSLEIRRGQFARTLASQSTIALQVGRSGLPRHHYCALHIRRRTLSTRISWPPPHITQFHSCRISWRSEEHTSELQSLAYLV